MELARHQGRLLQQQDTIANTSTISATTTTYSNHPPLPPWLLFHQHSRESSKLKTTTKFYKK